MQQAINSDPDLAPIARQLSIDLTPEGLRVQIKDAEGAADVRHRLGRARTSAPGVLKRLTPMLIGLHEPIAIAGYTDAAPYAGPGRTNWDLSADRANATRRILTEGGLPDDRISDVTGHADRDLLLPPTRCRCEPARLAASPSLRAARTARQASSRCPFAAAPRRPKPAVAANRSRRLPVCYRHPFQTCASRVSNRCLAY